MFLKTSQSGYTRNGEQFARGSFLIVFSHNQYKWESQNNTPHVDLHGQTFDVASGDGFVVQKTCRCAGTDLYINGRKIDTFAPGDELPNVPSYYLRYCPVHSGEYKTMPTELSRKLYACVRHVSLRQMGHWMIGSARIAGQSVTCSGAYGSDGLTRDYEELNADARAKVTELPADLIETFWKGGGHNTSGNEAPAMREWALKTLKGGK